MMLSRAPDVWDGAVPITQAWMKKDYCPYLAECVGPESIEGSLSNILQLEMTKEPSCTTAIKGNMGLLVQRASKTRRTAYGGVMPRGEIALFITFFTPDSHFKDHYSTTEELFNDHARAERYIGVFPIDEHLYVLPYILRHRRITANMRGSIVIPFDFLFDVPENHKRLLSLNLIEGNIRKNSHRGLKRV